MTTAQLTNIKTARSRNGYSLKAKLLIDNNEVCLIDDLGDGSMPKITIINPIIYNELESKISELPEIYVPEYDMCLKIDITMFMDMLHASQISKKPFNLLAA